MQQQRDSKGDTALQGASSLDGQQERGNQLPTDVHDTVPELDDEQGLV